MESRRRAGNLCSEAAVTKLSKLQFPPGGSPLARTRRRATGNLPPSMMVPSAPLALRCTFILTVSIHVLPIPVRNAGSIFLPQEYRVASAAKLPLFPMGIAAFEPRSDEICVCEGANYLPREAMKE